MVAPAVASIDLSEVTWGFISEGLGEEEDA